jgi:hypothetical protein
MSTLSLDQRLREVERRLLAGKPLGPTAEMPFGIFVYAPTEEQELRRQVMLSGTRLELAGRRVTEVDLGALMWECLREHPGGPHALAEAEQSIDALAPVLAEAHTLLVGESSYEPGPLEQRIVERLQPLDAGKDVAYLVRAGELFPLYRTSALLERLLGHVKVPTLLFYPGVLYGTTELRFMGVCEPSPNYRPTIYN